MGNRVDRFKNKRPNEGTREKKGGCGCFGTGCFVLIVLFLCAVVAVFVLYRHVRQNYTAATAADFVATPPPKAQRDAAQQKIAAIGDAIRKNKAQTFRLTGQDLDALAAAGSESRNVKGAVHIQITDRLAAQFSFPLDGVPGFGGRHLNGEAELDVRCENGVLEIFLQRATANGRDLPAWMLRDLRKQNLAVKLYDNPDARDALKHISSISLGDGAATLTTEGK